MKIVGIIPSRLQSTRLPRKPLHKMRGKFLVQWVYEGASSYKGFDKLLVATDSQEIADVVHSFGGEAVLTSSYHETGSNRVYEASKDLNADIIVNVQGDEPLIDCVVLEALIEPLKKDKNIGMSTLKRKFDNLEDYLSPNKAKVLVDEQDRALGFSRKWSSDEKIPPNVFHHVGLYAYRREVLEEFSRCPRSALEIKENLEQIRILEMDVPIAVPTIFRKLIGIDTLEDVQEFERIFDSS
ncbi:MAG: 3-deoxy-manno-octulosonate cytidylyltransferase [Deltaproteobacteria bacterium]|nr:3-deoxy-manno-octulosonate cytidylyltransferase [Deltaproteobacteria bacterium]